ncbi:universal stress protein UspA [Thermogymnomonas acidicola]|uniref:Universal stress protein UspA n=1 Tax=Thermogymnomonas acidicola TaxID=399579 RepID=A0AA37BSE3_9ARCH|nr:universal stress protein [Thermogymnomonas acidicola]GGM78244.1 universal stress protein UspA [Thermogymnomonas acidicola]
MKILIAFDNSSASRQALLFSLKFRPVVEEYIVAYVMPQIVGAAPTFDAYVPATVYERQEQNAETILDSARELVKDSGINLTLVKIDAAGDQVARALYRNALERGADLIITGTRKLTGLSRVLLGSVSSELIKVSRIPVLVVPPPPE